MFLGKDTKYKAGQVQGDTGAIDESDARVEDRIIIFIRHGESTWNQTFNPGARARPSAHPQCARQPLTARAGSGDQEQAAVPGGPALRADHGVLPPPHRAQGLLVLRLAAQHDRPGTGTRHNSLLSAL